MNLKQLKSIIEEEIEPFLILKGTTPWQFEHNKEIFKNISDKYNNWFKNIMEFVYLIKNKDRLNVLHIFCECGNKNKFNSINYGYNTYCSLKCTANSKNVRNKAKKTCLEKYGVENQNKNRIIREKSKQTCLKKYGVEYSFQSENNINKSKQTRLKKYGDENFNNIEKAKKTLLKKYGVDNYAKSKIRKIKLSNKEFIHNWVNKVQQTKKKNNSFNTSKSEDKCFKLLKTKFLNIIRQFKSDLYPFNCDFYIPCKDLYIECNFHWTHGKEPFNKNNSLHLEQLEKWKSKNTKFYNNAIKVWTIRDVNKLEILKKNHLNYKIFYDENGFMEWYNQL